MRLRLFSLALLTVLTVNACAPVVYVQRPPPPPRYGAIGYAPGPGYVWTDGYWGWQGGAYVWMPGRWIYPPRRGLAWQPAYWTRGRRGRWVMVRGHWR